MFAGALAEALGVSWDDVCAAAAAYRDTLRCDGQPLTSAGLVETIEGRSKYLAAKSVTVDMFYRDPTTQLVTQKVTRTL